MMATGGGRSSSGEGDALDRFPAGLRVLVVDDDRISLKLLEHMIRKCLYEVTVCSESMKALSLLRGSKDSFDIVISDVHMPDMDGFMLLELVGLEMDLPVIMMSGDERTSAVMRGIKHGACDYLIKPVRMQDLKTIGQHAVRKSLNIDSKEHGYSGSRELEVSDCRNASSDDECGRLQKQKKKKKKKKKKRQFAAAKGKDGSDEDGELDNDEPSTSKKPRIVWTFDLHQKFCIAVNQLGIDNAVPNRVLELMNVPGLTRENVASHLQKYRISLKRMVHHGGPIEATPTSMLLGRQVVSCTSNTNIVLPPLERPNFIHNSTQHCHHVGGDGFNQTQLVECNSNMSDPFFANTNIIALDNVVSSGYSDCWSPNNNFGMTQQQQLQTPSLMIPSTATYQLPIHQNSFGDAGSMTIDYNTLFSSHENFKTSGLLSNVYGSMPGPFIDNNNSTNSNSSNHFSSSGF